MDETAMIELRIYNQQYSMDMASIPIKCGFTTCQVKRHRTPTGKVVEYSIRVKFEDENADTSK